MNKLTLKDICLAAKRLGCDAAAIRAVDAVESLGGGFLPSGKLKILFERHHFSRLTGRKYDGLHPQISSRTPGGYYGGENEYLRFSEAAALDLRAALMSASWGRYQIMGFNHGVVGFKTVHEFVDAMKTGEGAQLMAFCRFCETNNLDDELRRRDWAGFARGYNGAGYRKNQYDEKLAAAYAKFKRENVDCAKILEESKILDAVETKIDALPSSAARSATPATQEPAPAVSVSVSAPDPAEQPAVQPPTFTPETIVVDAPPKENSTQNGVGAVAAAFGLPLGLGTAVKAIQDLAVNGFIDAKELGAVVLGIVRDHSKYVMLLVALVLVGLMLKKAYRQVSMLILAWINSDPNRHNVEIRPQ